jgi:dihydrofolate synthase / folylpolyglutamate synthase
MDYDQTLEYLYSRLPYFSRDGQSAIKKSLDNIYAFTEALGKPHQAFPSIHIAGTNGKGSVSHMLASVFQENGYKTGLYTSPHLTDFRERIKVNGLLAEKKFVVQFVRQHAQLIEQIKPSFFEITVAMAFEYFAINKVEIAIIETGLGGRLDSTNIIEPELSIITHIALDHQDMLGDTLPLIATEKAGIIKPNTPVLIGRFQDECHEVFSNKSKELAAPLYYARDIVKTTPYSSDLTGIYQAENIQTVMAAIKLLTEQSWKLDEGKIKSAVMKVKANTGLRGRWETLHHTPKVIGDVGHNPEGIEQIVNSLKNLKYNQLHWILGMVSDKKSEDILSLLPKEAVYYYCRPNIPRGLNEHELFQKAQVYELKGKVYDTCLQAYEAAAKNAGENDLILIAGSTFVLAEIIDKTEHVFKSTINHIH